MRERWTAERSASGRSLSTRRFWERVLASPRRRSSQPLDARGRRGRAVALCGAFGWRHFYGADAGTAGRDKANSAQAPAPIPVTVAQAKKADFPVYLNGLGAVEPYQTVLIRSRVDGAIVKIAFKQGQMVKQGDVLAQDRSASLSGGARSGAGEEGAGRGEPERRAAQPAALRRPRQEGFRFASAARHPAGDGRSTDRADQGRPGDHRQRPDASRLYDNPLSAHGQDGLSPGRRRQHRARRRHDGHRDDCPVAADLGRVHGA